MTDTLPSNGETLGLLADHELHQPNEQNSEETETPSFNSSDVALATTAATSIYAYAKLLCDDPTHCEGLEQKNYAKAVAAAALVANISGLVVLGPLASISKKNDTVGLTLWLVIRMLSVLFLATGYRLGNILIALSSQAFRGLASDNLLHFQLNAIYVQHPKSEVVSKLIGTSLALYMIGISVGPFVPSLFHDEVIGSFIMASAIFGVALLYLLGYTIGVSGKPKRRSDVEFFPPDTESRSCRSKWSNALRIIVHKVLSPLHAFLMQPIALWPGISLLLYNTGQAFAFPVIMVHTTLRFGFTAKENGILISIAHATAAAYLFCSLYLVPRMVRSSIWGYVGPHPPPTLRCPRTSDGICAMCSLAMQSTALLLFGLARHSWQVYPITCLFALGLTTSSFIKSYTVLCFPLQDAPRAIAALSVVETAGGVLAPAVLGGLQVMSARAEVLFVAAIIMGLATWTFVWNVASTHMGLPVSVSITPVFASVKTVAILLIASSNWDFSTANPTRIHPLSVSDQEALERITLSNWVIGVCEEDTFDGTSSMFEGIVESREQSFCQGQMKVLDTDQDWLDNAASVEDEIESIYRSRAIVSSICDS
ncbi:hypothetical protein G7Y79_00067g095630 [Physcia stellaris]|nr:hypothetical protein G7Y79_00067g095630 [Physcia stellaris]